MKIHFSFPDDKVSFNCGTCSAVCCHVNNYLLMNEDQYAAALEENALAMKLSKQDENKYYLRVGKQCWFLQNNKCSIHSNKGIAYKPTSCSIYPLRVWLINDEILVVDYIPCPDFSINGNRSIKHISYESNVIDYVKLLGIQNITNKKLKVSEERLLYEENFRDSFEGFITQYLEQKAAEIFKFTDCQINYITKLLWLYPQVRLRPSVLALPEKWSLVTLDIYFKVILESLNIEWGNGGLQNAYTLILNEFNNQMENIYSFERG